MEPAQMPELVELVPAYGFGMSYTARLLRNDNKKITVGTKIVNEVASKLC